MLRTLVDEGWFEKSNKGYYTLSPRALMELRGWLIETYNDVDDDDEDDDDERPPRIKQCVACKEIVTVTEWTSDVFVGERAAPTNKPSSRRSVAGWTSDTSRITMDGPDQNSDPSEIDR
ncbi:MAG: hypothetical protein Q9180_003440 [Flavoplaca navasiana]